jgi:hypothetical protein
MGHLGSVVVGNGFDSIRWLYSIIGEFGAHISVGNKYGAPGIGLVKEQTNVQAKRFYVN